VRYYLAQGLLPAVGQSGPGSKYGADHLDRLRLIRRLQAEHLPLAEIRHRLEGLDPDAIRDLAGSPEPAPPTDSALDYLRTVLGTNATGRPAASPDTEPTVACRVPRHARLMLATAASAVPDARDPRDAPASAMPLAVAAATTKAEPSPTPSIERSQWERIVLAPDVELHLRRPLSRTQNKQVDRLVTIARELLEEDRP
jgi:DNA-binding transcriptional MerR regulator